MGIGNRSHEPGPGHKDIYAPALQLDKHSVNVEKLSSCVIRMS